MPSEFLGNRYRVFVNKNHTFGTDAVLLANFAIRRKVKKACDLGTGCGIIPLLWLDRNLVDYSVGVEIQTDAYNLCEAAVTENKLDGKFLPINSDLKDLKGKLPFGEFDVVSCNPPYKKSGAGIVNDELQKQIARHETLCTLDDICSAAARLLRFGGKLSLCHRPERLADIFESMRKHKIEPKRLRTVIQRRGNSPWLVLVEGSLGGKPALTIEPPLFVEENGLLSDEMMSIYGEYKKGKGRKI